MSFVRKLLLRRTEQNTIQKQRLWFVCHSLSENDEIMFIVMAEKFEKAQGGDDVSRHAHFSLGPPLSGTQLLCPTTVWR